MRKYFLGSILLSTVVQPPQVSSIFICKWGQMRSLRALEPRSGAAEENCLIGNTFSCLAGVVTNTKYVHIYLQQQLWEHSAVQAAEAKSFETSMFQHKFHVSDKKIQSSQILSTSRSHHLHTTALPDQNI